MLAKQIEKNYDLRIIDLKHIDSHFGTDLYLLQTDQNKYIVKSLPLNFQNLENEGYITDFLYEKGISVAKLLKTTKGEYIVKTDMMQFHIQEFIEGKTFEVNTAPDWFLEKSAVTLGRIHSCLKEYKMLKRSFDTNFFDVSKIQNKKKHLLSLLEAENDSKDEILKLELMEQIKHADKIATFYIDTNKLTYSNSHGDYYINQIITDSDRITVIDWSSACCLPLCIEVIMSYTFTDPACINGEINVCRLKNYIKQYLQFYKLNQYDIRIMPYVFYWHQFLTNYTPPFTSVPKNYKAVSMLINKLLNWLFENVNKLSEELK